MAVTERSLQQEGQERSPLQYMPLRRDADAMAASIARLSTEQEIPPEQVVSIWAVQKGPRFVDKLLETPTYASLSERAKAALRTTAARAVSDALLESIGFSLSAAARYDQPYFHRE